MGIDRKREEEKRAKWLDRKWKREDIGVNVMGRINNRDTRGKCVRNVVVLFLGLYSVI